MTINPTVRDAFLYQIAMATGLVLSVDKNNPGPGEQLILAQPNSEDSDQVWEMVFYPATPQGNLIQASILYNRGRSLFAAPSSVAQGQPVILFTPLPAYGLANTWQIQPESSAIRTPFDTTLNLNAYGPTWNPGTKIVMWPWGGGQPNETWTSKLVSVP